jgi:hypothetical protein
MIRLNLLAIGLVSILALTSCKTAETPPTADSAGKAMTDATNTAKDKATDVAGAAKDKATEAAGAAKDAAGAAKDKATEAAGAAKDAAGAAKDKATTAAGKLTGTAPAGVASLTGVVTKTRTAIDAGDFEKAKMEISQFEGAWSKVEDGVKAKSPAAYDAIETSMKDTTGAVNAEDKPKALAALKALDNAVALAAK